MRVLPGLVPLATVNRTSPPSTAHAVAISLTARNEGSSRDPMTHDP